MSDKTRSGECSCHRCLTRLVIDIYISHRLRNTRSILSSVISVVDRLESGESIVLSGNSTPLSQVIGLVQVCSDPYYRTIFGFGVLVEKEWARYGLCSLRSWFF